MFPSVSASSRRCLKSLFTQTKVYSKFSFTTRSMSTELNPDDRPSPPLRYDEGHLYQPLNLSELSNKIMVTYEQRQEAYEMSRNIQASTQQIRDHPHLGSSEVDVAIQGVLDTYKKTALAPDIATLRTPRDANLSYTVEDLLRLTSYQHFLSTGKVLPPVPWSTDEEYLAGAIMGLCSDLQSYGLGRATVRDVRSVHLAAQTVGACLEYLLSLDFRNGPLRRKYDGCKYSLKNLETFLYELAVTSSTAESSAPTMKRKPIEEILPMPELTSLRERFVFRDDLRETLIKKCRDGQKMAKQSIFCLHRGDPKAAYKLIEDCAEYILTDLLPTVQIEPPLRAGSFASVLEEYVEAKLFYVWLHGRGDSIADRIGKAIAGGEEEEAKPPKDVNLDELPDRFQMASGIILLPQDFARDFILLEPDEYVGGLCDLTGEIGRYAVQRGTARDVASVRQCLYTNANILSAIQSMERCSDGSPSGNQIMKKMETVRNSVQKIERMLYELSLSEAAGGRPVSVAEPQSSSATKGNQSQVEDE
jgi:predicted translin family RNA/ssDNA-binding protein